MLRPKIKVRSIRYSMWAFDVLCIVGALGLAIGLRYIGARDGTGFVEHLRQYPPMILTAVVAWTLLYFEMSLDGFKGGWKVPTILSKLIVAVSLLMAVVLAFAFATNHFYSRLVLLYFGVFFFFELVGLRCLVRFLITSDLKHMTDSRCVILGNGPLGRELADKIASHPELPFHIVGFLFPGEPESSNGFAKPFQTTHTSVKTLQVLELLAQQKIQKVIIAMAQPHGAEVRKLIAECQKLTIQVYLVPQLYDLYTSRAELVEIDGLPLLALQERNPSIAGLALKRAMDLLLSTGILFLTSPILLPAALFVYRKKGKAFRAELRCGRNGVPFPMYRLNIDRHPMSLGGYERFLVRWSLTELPQLWNVLRGDMSLVGPRPESAERLKYYSNWQRQRLKVRGGVTGLAQVHGLREQHSSEDKTRFDLQYILNWSVFLDLSLIVQTVWTVTFRGLSQEPTFVHPQGLHGRVNEYLTTEVADANRS